MINTDDMKAALKMAERSAESCRMHRIPASYRQAAADAIAAGAELIDASAGEGLHFKLEYKGFTSHVFTKAGIVWSEPNQGVVLKLRCLPHPWDLRDVVRIAVGNT